MAHGDSRTEPQGAAEWLSGCGRRVSYRIAAFLRQNKNDKLSVDLLGWVWSRAPEKQHRSEENRIVFLSLPSENCQRESLGLKLMHAVLSKSTCYNILHIPYLDVSKNAIVKLYNPIWNYISFLFCHKKEINKVSLTLLTCPRTHDLFW